MRAIRMFWMAVACLSLTVTARADGPIYELRTYVCNEGKLEDLNRRFRTHTTRLFEKHGMKNVGYFVPMDADKGSADTLIYVLAHASRAAAAESWKAFGNDPEWKAAKAASEPDGTPLVKKVESVYCDATDYGPLSGIEPAATPRVFELRTYTASPGKLADLHKRFRDHTTQLFQKHGMTNVLYLVPQDPAHGKDDTLVYFLAHPGREAAAQSWNAFINDPEWQNVYKASQADGIPLAAKNESIFLIPTDYSPLR